MEVQVASQQLEQNLVVDRKAEIEMEFRKVLDEKFKNQQGKKILELGVGARTLIPFLSDKFGEKVFRMELADWNLRNKKIHDGLVQGDLLNLPIAPNSVDVVVSFNKFKEGFDLQRAMDEVQRILNIGGEALLVIPEEYFKSDKLAIQTGLEVAESRPLPLVEDLGPSRIVTFKKNR